MHYPCVFTIFVIFLTIIQSSCVQKSKFGTEPKDSQLNFTQLAGKYGYYAEEHTVTTEDGYILKIFRMRARQCEGERPPVLLMHGLLMSSDSFLNAGPGNGLAYLLSDVCFDVWSGNVRGNYYSRAHVTLNPNEADFWNFSYDQMGYYDNPAIVDHILKTTGHKKLSYIGYSQGTGIGFIMCSERPGYCDKLNIFINLAPSTRHLYTKSRFARALVMFFMRHERLFEKAGVHELLRKSEPNAMTHFIVEFCHTRMGEAMMRSIISLLDSYHRKSLSSSTVRTVCGRSAAGSSLRTVVQYGQAMKSKCFQKFDYGADNIKIYGSVEPPSYNLRATTAPVVLFYGEKDGMVDPIDVMWLAAQLPNLVEAYLVPDPKWNHMDFGNGQDMPKLIFPKIKQYLLRYIE
ncbi:lipase 1-like [Plodia interpunctella]|uniref:lipase 1-like n=1 Tax=Plodia interpunctella TaxID=58824 RepID=UPI00236772CF|nr:lipase 1-like [Plodia interpunctella]